MDIILWKEVMMISYYKLCNLERGWILGLFYYCQRQKWSEISILVSVGKGHFEDPNIEKDCHYNRISRITLKKKTIKHLLMYLGGLISWLEFAISHSMTCPPISLVLCKCNLKYILKSFTKIRQPILPSIVTPQMD